MALRADGLGTHRVAFEKNKKRILKTKSICGICGKLEYKKRENNKNDYGH